MHETGIVPYNTTRPMRTTEECGNFLKGEILKHNQSICFYFMGVVNLTRTKQESWDISTLLHLQCQRNVAIRPPMFGSITGTEYENNAIIWQ